VFLEIQEEVVTVIFLNADSYELHFRTDKLVRQLNNQVDINVKGLAELILLV
jgi:hypothetical protein